MRCGDEFAIHAFSSLKRNRVYIQQCKSFEEPMSARIEDRIGGLRPGFYTRLGAAIRHASADLARQSKKRRLLLVITDGKPNDLDHYEGRHGIEDTAMAVREARRAGHAVFGVTIDKNAKSWFPRLFGSGCFSCHPQPRKTDRSPANDLPRACRSMNDTRRAGRTARRIVDVGSDHQRIAGFRCRAGSVFVGARDRSRWFCAGAKYAPPYRRWHQHGGSDHQRLSGCAGTSVTTGPDRVAGRV